MAYLSRIIGSPVRDRAGEHIAVVKDLIVRINDRPYPLVSGVVARQGRRDFFIGAHQIAAIDESGVVLNTNRLDLGRFARRGDEVLLSRHVLDRQLIDVDGRRIIRVNDLQIHRSPRGYQVVGVDVSPQALLRRLGLQRFVRRMQPRDVLDWADVEYFASEASAVRLKVSHEKLSKLHPTDIARLVDSVSYRQGAEIMDSLDVDTAADAMEEMTPERQADLVEGMDEERAADIIERMAPDDAADLLADLDDEKARDILDRMEEEASDDVEELLSYGEDTAGGLMTPDFVRVTAGMTVGEAIEHMRSLDYEPDMVYYVYVVSFLGDDPPVLQGIASLRDMIMAGLDAPMSAVMVSEFHCAAPDTPASEVAAVVSEYNLLALPVLEGDRILGIVTVDDVMERLLPGTWRERLPKLFR